MKKILLIVVLVLALFGYMTYGWMKSNGWTVFSQAGTEPVSEVVESVATSTSLLFVGDVMLGRYVETLANQEGDRFRSFKQVQDFLKQHITIANLEGPIPDAHKPTPINGFTFSFPSSTPSILKEGGITAVSLANNHMFDYGKSGYEDTKRALTLGGVSHFGGYSPTESDYFETRIGATKVVVYGITMIATDWDESQALSVTSKLRAEHPGAHLVAFVHWGDEYATQNIHQRSFAHALIDAGVDTIIGAHAHVVQGIEVYKGKPVFYSLGNFIFDQYWKEGLEDGLMVKMSLDIPAPVYELVPIYSIRSVPYIATSTVRDRILSSVSRQSDAALQERILEGSLILPK